MTEVMGKKNLTIDNFLKEHFQDDWTFLLMCRNDMTLSELTLLLWKTKLVLNSTL